MKRSKALWIIILLVVLLGLSGYFNLLNYFRHHYLQFPFPEDTGKQRARDDYDCGRVWLIATGDFSGSRLNEDIGLFWGYDPYVDDSIISMNEIVYSLAYNEYILSRILYELRVSLYNRFGCSTDWKKEMLEKGRLWSPGKPGFEIGENRGKWLIRKEKEERRWFLPIDSDVVKVKYLYKYPLVAFAPLNEKGNLMAIYIFWNKPLLLLKKINVDEDEKDSQ